jgi:hypothetical protein
LSFVYAELVGELKDRWRIETQAALVGWHFAGALSAEGPPDRPQLADWTDVRRAFDEWLISAPSGAAGAASEMVDDAAVSPEELDVMIAYGWRNPDD